MELPSEGERLVYDTACQQLAVRLRPGSRTYIFVMWDRERRRAAKVTLGKAGTMTPEQARTQAQRKVAEVADGKDVRRKAPDSIAVNDVWTIYLAKGKPKKKAAWKPRYLADLKAMAAAGGVQKKRGRGLTRPGPLYPLMALPLASVNEDSLKAWFDREAMKGRHQAARALMMFRGFLRWCSAQPDYRDLADANAARGKVLADVLPATTRRTDALDRAHLPAWFAAVRALSNATASAYLQALLLTGARREEMAALKWSDVDVKGGTLDLADKVGERRTIPLTPHVAALIAELPRLNAFVFASPSAKSGHIAEPRTPLENALKAADLPHLSIHGLRRSFTSLSEAAGVPAGAAAQIQGHRPSGVHEGYTIRRIEDLRDHAERIEQFILERAGIVSKGGMRRER
jgi:integrase